MLCGKSMNQVESLTNDEVEIKMRSIARIIQSKMSITNQERHFQRAIAIECQYFFSGSTVVTEQPVQTIYVDSMNTTHSLGTDRVDIYIPEIGLFIELKKQRPQLSHELQLQGYMNNAKTNGLKCELGILICFYIEKGNLKYSLKRLT